MNTGKFIVFEGPNFSGKSTAMRELQQHLEAQGHEVVVCREPGGTPFGEAIRPVLKNPATKACGFATALGFCACRKQLNVAVLAPALARGAIVLCDRYYMSTEIFQMRLSKDLTDAERDILAAFHKTLLQPDLVVFLLPSPQVIASRIARAERDSPDRFEGNPLELHAYESYASEYGQNAEASFVRPQLTDEGQSKLPQILDHAVFAGLRQLTAPGA